MSSHFSCVPHQLMHEDPFRTCTSTVVDWNCRVHVAGGTACQNASWREKPVDHCLDRVKEEEELWDEVPHEEPCSEISEKAWGKRDPWGDVATGDMLHVLEGYTSGGFCSWWRTHTGPVMAVHNPSLLCCWHPPEGMGMCWGQPTAVLL